MKHNAIRLAAFCLCLALLRPALWGCAPTGANSAAPAETGAEGEKPFAGVELTYAVSDTALDGHELTALCEMVQAQTGIIITPVVVPYTPSGAVDKTLVMLQAGDELDIVYRAYPSMKTFYTAGVLYPLNELALNSGYDMQAVFGQNLDTMSDGKVYSLPAFLDIWVTLYNKQVFDDAGVPYPTAKGWTWEKYLETARLVSDAQNGVWGSQITDYDNCKYMLATQMGAVGYKADGTANFDDPLYAQSVQFLGDMYDGVIQPVYQSAASVYQWNSFLTGGNIAMHVDGSWFCSLLPDLDKYPRDWKVGILPMPYPEGYEPSTLVVTGTYAVPVTSKNKEAAFEAIRCIAENQYLLGYGRIPARTDLSDEEVRAYIRRQLLDTLAFDEITEEEIMACWFSGRTQLPEKIIGPADAAIGQIIIEECNKYYSGEIELAECMQNIQSRANRAIEVETATGPGG